MRGAADLIVGNLDANGYLTATEEEMAQTLAQMLRATIRPEPIPFERGRSKVLRPWDGAELHHQTGNGSGNGSATLELVAAVAPFATYPSDEVCLRAVVQARELMQQLDPIGVGARDLRECLLVQICAQRREAALAADRQLHIGLVSGGLVAGGLVAGKGAGLDEALEEAEYGDAVVPVQAKPSRDQDVFQIATHIVAHCLPLLQKKDMRELTKSCGRSADEVQAAVEYIRTLDPRPGQRYNLSETRLIEPDVAFVKRDEGYVVVMNEEDMPTLRLNQGYRKMLREKQTEKEVREYVKERYKSAIQLLRNIEQSKNTIVRTCEAIVRRQGEFLERGEQALKPMMIKEVAEEIGVHPSTVSRAVANKYVHTAQGVYELRFFFSEGVNGPEGGDLPLVLLKRKVKKLIEEEDSRKPLTDDHLAAELKAQGINVTRRTVAKYREDMQIPSTHQRRVR